MKKEFNWENYHERQIALKINYFGMDLRGFTRQDGTENTVEDYLFKSLLRSKLIQDPDNCNYSICGRTDAGVSGIGNVVSLRVRSVAPSGVGCTIREGAPIRDKELNYVQIINGPLPETIRVTAVAYVPSDFSARYNCKGRGYRYMFHKEHKNIAAMEAGARYLIGEHDFRAFCKFAPENTPHCIRKIFTITFNHMIGDIFYFEIHGSGFVWHQVRCIAAVLFLIGDGLEKPEIILDLLDKEKYPGRPQYHIAPPEPLVFWEAKFDGINWIEDEFPSSQNFYQILKRHEIRSAMLKMFTGNGDYVKRRKSYVPLSKLQITKSIEQSIEEFRAKKTKEKAME